MGVPFLYSPISSDNVWLLEVMIYCQLIITVVKRNYAQLERLSIRTIKKPCPSLLPVLARSYFTINNVGVS